MAVESSYPRYTVTSLTADIKRALEGGYRRIILDGEISGWRRYPSGHCYFTLKDDGAQISAVMFSNSYESCKAKDGMKDGAKVSVFGNVTVYPPRGNYQITVLSAKLAGVGELMQRYLELKAKLAAEGLFDAARKRTLPFMPRRIGIVTSEAGAVIHDMCTVMARRFPNVHVRLFPSLVQGDTAPASIVAGIRYFNSGEWTPDLLIVARGGGSFEDLFCFNDETLVREVAASKVPTVSAVGHETDYTLCDFAADVRAGTPSIAAEISVPVLADIVSQISNLNGTMASALRSRGDFFAQRVDHLSASIASSLVIAVTNAAKRVERSAPRLGASLALAVTNAANRIERVGPQLSAALTLRLQRDSARLEKADAKLVAYSPYGVLERGYSLTTAADGSVVRDASSLKKGDVITSRFACGSVSSVVQ